MRRIEREKEFRVKVEGKVVLVMGPQEFYLPDGTILTWEGILDLARNGQWVEGLIGMFVTIEREIWNGGL